MQAIYYRTSLPPSYNPYTFSSYLSVSLPLSPSPSPSLPPSLPLPLPLPLPFFLSLSPLSLPSSLYPPIIPIFLSITSCSCSNYVHLFRQSQGLDQIYLRCPLLCYLHVFSLNIYIYIYMRYICFMKYTGMQNIVEPPKLSCCLTSHCLISPSYSLSLILTLSPSLSLSLLSLSLPPSLSFCAPLRLPSSLSISLTPVSFSPSSP